MTVSDARLALLAQRVEARLRAAATRVVTAESCTGGYLAKLLTDIPDSSDWFDCGYVTYSNAAKVRDLGVQDATLTSDGAVSEATVLEMAHGALARTGVDIAVSISGVAGPAGGTARNPVGSAWFALAWRDGDGVRERAAHRQFAGDRDAVRRESAAFALEMLLET